MLNDYITAAALRMFVAHDGRESLLKPLYDEDGRIAYATDGRCAVRMLKVYHKVCDSNPSGMVPKIAGQFEGIDRHLGIITADDVEQAATVAIDLASDALGFARVEKDEADGECYIHDPDEFAFVSIPGGGVFRASYMMRAISSMRISGNMCWGCDIYSKVWKEFKCNVLRLSARNGLMDVVVAGMAVKFMGGKNVVVDVSSCKPMKWEDVIERHVYEGGAE